MALPPGLPKHTLGYGVLDWATENLAHPDGNDWDRPWIYTNEQARFIVWWYAIDESGEFVYRRAVIERPKGSGKSPGVASLAACELLGPVQFSHWELDGREIPAYHPGAVPIATPNPDALIQVAAISEAQVENSYGPLLEMLHRRGADDRYGLELGQTRVLAPGGRRIERVTASPRSREGRKTTFAILDETWLWVPSERGPELAGVIAGNVAKVNGRLIETTNAFRPGENSVAEASNKYAMSIMAGEAQDDGLLFDSRRGHCDDIYDHDQFIEAAKYAYGDAYWVPLERLFREVNDPMNSESEMRRKYLNELHSQDTAWLDHKRLEDCRSDDVPKLKKGQPFALGFKAATRDGAGALVACRLEDQAFFLLGLWEPPQDPQQARDWEVPAANVDAVVRQYLEWMPEDCFMQACPHKWQDVVGRWSVDYEGVEEFWTSQHAKMAKALEQFEEAVNGQRVLFGRDRSSDALLRHVGNAYRENIALAAADREGGDRQPYIIRRESAGSKRWIVAAQAAVLAFEGAVLSIENGALEDKSVGELYSF